MRNLSRSPRRRFQWLAVVLVIIAGAAVALTSGYTYWSGPGRPFGQNHHYYYGGPYHGSSYYPPYASYYSNPYYYTFDTYYRTYDPHYARQYPDYLDYAIAGHNYHSYPSYNYSSNNTNVNTIVNVDNNVTLGGYGGGYSSSPWWNSWNSCGYCEGYSWRYSPWGSVSISQSANVDISLSLIR